MNNLQIYELFLLVEDLSSKGCDRQRLGGNPTHLSTPPLTGASITNFLSGCLPHALFTRSLARRRL